jgi:hypothetical protein
VRETQGMRRFFFKKKSMRVGVDLIFFKENKNKILSTTNFRG